MHFAIVAAFAGFSVSSLFNKSLIDTFTRPKVYAKASHCVVLPDPGGPSIMILGGLLGASLLYLSFMILRSSF